MPSKELRERTRRAVRAELTRTAIDLFATQGYDETSVEAIAEAAGISRASFFRYFASKDDVLTDAMEETGRAAAQALLDRPGDEEPWLALRRCFDDFLAQASSDPRALELTTMMLRSPALYGRLLLRQEAWRESLAEALSARSAAAAAGEGSRSLAERALSGSAIACLQVAQTRWATSGGTEDFAPLLDRAMGAVASLT